MPLHFPDLKSKLHLKKPSRPSPKTTVIGLGAIFVCLLFVGFVYFFLQYQKTQSEIAKLKSQIPTDPASETQILVETIGTFIELPSGEQPTLATITDKEKLSGQSFFTKAENGDKLLIYPQARKVYLYRPATGKVIDIAPINTEAAPTPQVEK